MFQVAVHLVGQPAPLPGVQVLTGQHLSDRCVQADVGSPAACRSARRVSTSSMRAKNWSSSSSRVRVAHCGAVHIVELAVVVVGRQGSCAVPGSQGRDGIALDPVNPGRAQVQGGVGPTTICPTRPPIRSRASRTRNARRRQRSACGPRPRPAMPLTYDQHGKGAAATGCQAAAPRRQGPSRECVDTADWTWLAFTQSPSDTLVQVPRCR